MAYETRGTGVLEAIGQRSKRLRAAHETEDPSGFRSYWPMNIAGGTFVQTRLLSCIAGGFLGVALTSPINSILGLPPALAWVACTCAGVAVGYVVSMLIDVFAVSSADNQSIK
jgi:hypothetical protein